MLVNLGDTVCLGPAKPQKPLNFTVPKNAWDCHAHVIGGPPDYPYVQPRHFTPHPVTADDFLGVLDTEGFRYGAVVQVSVHGTDNGYMLEALSQHRGRLTGTAVIARDTPERDLLALKEGGISGIRLLEAKGGVGIDDLEWFGDRCAELGWNIQLCVPSDRYREALPRLRKLGAPLVIDHMGWFDLDETPDGPGFGAVLSLLRYGDTWLKLSGGFRYSREASPYADTLPFMRRLIETAPDRLIWGSDWPHVAIVDESKLPQYGALLDGLWSAASGDADILEKILVHNPARLYQAVIAERE